MINILITLDPLAALTQRIKNSQVSKINSRDKFQSDQNSSFEFRSKSTKQRSRRNDTTSNRTD